MREATQLELGLEIVNLETGDSEELFAMMA